MSRLWLWLMALAMMAGGCARVVTARKDSANLPPARLAPDAVALDVAFVRLPAADVESYEAIWEAADEQQIDAQVRRELATNGLRAGVFGRELPVRLRELLDAKPQALEDRSEDVDTKDAVIGGGKWHWQVRRGVRRKIVASKTYSTLPVLTSEDGRVRGRQLSKAQCIWALKPYPQGDGRVKLDLTPEIEHGDEKNGWVGSEGALVLRAGRDRLVLDRLRLEATLSPGEWLVLSTTREIKGLGEYSFAETAGGAVERTILLVRLSQTQLDDLFAPEQTSAPLATPGE